ncbi:MAG: c-type cytochrome [Candidatus Methylomirabilales bacterium]
MPTRDGPSALQPRDGPAAGRLSEGGQAVQKSQMMPPWGTQLKDQQIWDVIAYVRSLAVPPYKAQ